MWRSLPTQGAGVEAAQQRPAGEEARDILGHHGCAALGGLARVARQVGRRSVAKQSSAAPAICPATSAV